MEDIILKNASGRLKVFRKGKVAKALKKLAKIAGVEIRLFVTPKKIGNLKFAFIYYVVNGNGLNLTAWRTILDDYCEDNDIKLTETITMVEDEK